ncbi:hypothetical protein FQN50_005620 [Emmonsiellopsis sp. PD_5]|nr:hypothetical protein FQN50_005620 [Emmonsiellopsis sp. PD_5]
MQGQESEGYTRVVLDLDLPIRRHSVSQGPTLLSATCNSTTQDAGHSHHEEVFSLTPEAALRILCVRVDKLAEITGDVPSTTIPVENPADKKSVLLSSSGTASERNAHAETEKGDNRLIPPTALMKCFYSKKPSPISLETYLLRLHRYCPMSTAVYLATSYYITRIAVGEKIIYVTPRNMHRLVLGGLRVAMKMLEDLCYGHSRFARVGGVTERELTKLEINFSFLMDFELRVDEEMMFEEVEAFRKGA